MTAASENERMWRYLRRLLIAIAIGVTVMGGVAAYAYTQLGGAESEAEPRLPRLPRGALGMGPGAVGPQHSAPEPVDPRTPASALVPAASASR